MSLTPEKQARAGAMLGELAELGLMVAKELAIRLRESEDAEETVALAAAFQKMSRVVRLTLALDAKLDRESAREAREAQADRAAPEPEPDDTPPHPVTVRKRRVENLLTRLLWNESEGESEEFEILLGDLSARLEEAARSPDFETTPIDVIARRIVADMGLSDEFVLTAHPPPQQPERHSSA